MRLVGGVAFFVGGTGLAYLQSSGPVALPEGPGGIIGQAVGNQLMRGFGFTGATLFLCAVFLVALTLGPVFGVLTAIVVEIPTWVHSFGSGVLLTHVLEACAVGLLVRRRVLYGIIGDLLLNFGNSCGSCLLCVDVVREENQHGK